MPENSIQSQLRETFPSPLAEKWKQLASQELDGKNIDDVLAWNSEDGITFSAYYDSTSQLNHRLSDKFRLTVADDDYFGPAKWLNLPRVTVTDDQAANRLALQHLTNGADGIIFFINKPTSFKILLKDIDWRYCSIYFDGSVSLIAQQLAEFLPDGSNPDGGFFWDDVPNFALPNANLNNFIKISSATPVTEIANALVEGVRWAERDSTATQFRLISFSLNAGTAFLETIAKLKALRFLWLQIARAYGIEDYHPGNLFIHVRSEVWSHEKFQPHGNMLKGTTASMAAIIGGANGLTVMAEDELNTMMTRIARNVSNLLKEESHLDKVADPSAGSFAIDELTKVFAEQAWSQFQKKVQQ